MTRQTFTARCTRSGKWWAISVPEAEGLWTQARRLDQVEGMAREAISAVLDIDEVDIEIILDVAIGDPHLDEAIDTALRVRAELEELQEDSARQTSEAIDLLRREADLSMRDVALLLGISHQRVGQIARRG